MTELSAYITNNLTNFDATQQFHLKKMFLPKYYLQYLSVIDFSKMLNQSVFCVDCFYNYSVFLPGC